MISYNYNLKAKMRRNRPFSDVLPMNMVSATDAKELTTPFDLKKEYTNMKKFLEEEKRQEQQKFYSSLPFKMGYLSILTIIFFILCKSTYQTYIQLQENQKTVEAEADLCLVQFSSKKCEVGSLTEECQRFLTCLKTKDESPGTMTLLMLILSNTPII
jgi:hypothetical protein